MSAIVFVLDGVHFTNDSQVSQAALATAPIELDLQFNAHQSREPFYRVGITRRHMSGIGNWYPPDGCLVTWLDVLPDGTRINTPVGNYPMGTNAPPLENGRLRPDVPFTLEVAVQQPVVFTNTIHVWMDYFTRHEDK
jgi:hypothetical protein